MITQADLKKIRKDLNVTQMYFAKLLNCTLRMYQYYESMDKVMPLSLLELLEYKLKDLTRG